jgi:CRP-like cAMP-binding protein
MAGHPRAPFWYALTHAHRAALHDIGRLHRYARDVIIVREQDPSDFVVVLLDGCVKVSISGARGYQTVLGLRNPGDVVGEQAGLDGGVRSATLTTLTDVEALQLPAPRFRSYLEHCPEVATLLQRTVSARLREADRYRAAVGSETVPERLAGLLIVLAERYGIDDGHGGRRIDLPLSQEDLAGLILTSQRTLARILEIWRARELVRTGRRSIEILDPLELRRLAVGRR